MKLQKIGMRTIKTSLAVVLALLISDLLNLNSPFFASIATILAMKSSVSESLSLGKYRMLGTIFGGSAAVLFNYFIPGNIFTIGIAIIIIIYICNLLGWRKSTQLATIVFLSIIINYSEGSRLAYALDRTLATIIGLLIGTAVNYFIVPPNSNHQKYVEESINQIYFEFKKTLEQLIWKEEYCCLENLKELLNQLEEEYIILNKDTKLTTGKTQSASKFEKAFEDFEIIYYHLNTINELGGVPPINDENKDLIEEFFDRELPEQHYYQDKLSIVYNYHLEKILETLTFIPHSIGD